MICSERLPRDMECYVSDFLGEIYKKFFNTVITKTTATYDKFSHALHASVMKVHLALGNPVCVIFQY